MIGPGPNATKEELDAWNAQVYKHLYYNRGRHLLFLYSAAIGALLGSLLTHFLINWWR
jgi:hypothetical protein